MNIGNVVRWERRQSASQVIGDTTLTLESRALEVRLPFGGLVWNRPTAVCNAPPRGGIPAHRHLRRYEPHASGHGGRLRGRICADDAITQ